LAGDWIDGAQRPALEQFGEMLKQQPPPRRVLLTARELGKWDSSLLSFLLKAISACADRGIATDFRQLPGGVVGMLRLAQAVPERQDLPSRPRTVGSVAKLGAEVLEASRDVLRFADFLGEIVAAGGRLLAGRARFRAWDMLHELRRCGPDALPIVGLISILVGMILAFVGAVQLRMFGAQIFIADLVGLGMAREMGAMMTAILMAGRTGAAYAAELGSMSLNDEIDAFRTSGFPPMEFLVLPRLMALIIATPLLCVYADILGMFGGAIVSAEWFDVSYSEYFVRLENRLRLIDFEVGVFKSAVFGALVAIAGCMRGLNCGRNANAVGLATTSAVVSGIILIVVSDAMITLLITVLDLYRR
jgi:phospholipid/cholesterol/gamma-HCH transport system permease protein